MIIFCPKCNEELELPADAVGRKVQCAYCNEKFFATEEFVRNQQKEQKRKTIHLKPYFTKTMIANMIAEKKEPPTIYIKRCKTLSKEEEEEVKRRAEQGCPEAQYSLGERYFYAQGVQENHLEAYKWFSKAANQGLANAQRMVALCFYGGFGTNEDKVEAVKWYIKAAEQGNSRAQLELANCYFDGKGVGQNQHEALRLYYEVIHKGDKDSFVAALWLGERFLDGKGVDKNDSEAVRLIEFSAGNGLSTGQYRLGMCYLSGNGVIRDEAKAFEWFFMAANQGHADAQYELAKQYEQGEGTAKNQTESAKWYLKAATQGHTKAQVELGLVYYSRASSGEGDGGQDFSEAAKWFLRAAEEGGNVEAQAMISMMYEKGEGIAKDYGKAFFWSKIAAENGDVASKNALGRMYMKGIGVRKDFGKAVGCFFWVVEHGREEEKVIAMYFLGSMYGESGENQNLSESAKWYRMAAEHGETNAQRRLGEIYLNGLGVPKNREEAVKWFLKAAEQGSDVAKLRLNQIEESKQLKPNVSAIDESADDAFERWEHGCEQMNIVQGAKNEATNICNCPSSDRDMLHAKSKLKIQHSKRYSTMKVQKRVSWKREDEIFARMLRKYGLEKDVDGLALNPYCVRATIPLSHDESAVLNFANELFHRIGVLDEEYDIDFGEMTDYCRLDKDADGGCYFVSFNHHSIVGLNPDDNGYEYRVAAVFGENVDSGDNFDEWEPKREGAGALLRKQSTSVPQHLGKGTQVDWSHENAIFAKMLAKYGIKKFHVEMANRFCAEVSIPFSETKKTVRNFTNDLFHELDVLDRDCKLNFGQHTDCSVLDLNEITECYYVVFNHHDVKECEVGDAMYKYKVEAICSGVDDDAD